MTEALGLLADALGAPAILSSDALSRSEPARPFRRAS